jgi:hypothetical protein
LKIKIEMKIKIKRKIRSALNPPEGLTGKLSLFFLKGRNNLALAEGQGINLSTQCEA